MPNEHEALRRKVLLKAGNLAMAARYVVGGADLNGFPISPATLANCGKRLEDLKTAVDEYDDAVLELTENRDTEKEGTER